MAATITESAMAGIVRETLGIAKRKRKEEEDEIHRSFFGASLQIITILWNLLVPLIDEKAAAPKHLLWALVFIKVYSTTAVHRRIVGWPDPKTYRKWSWHFLKKIASLKHDIIQLDKRFEQWDGKMPCLLSLDGVDCMVNEPWSFDEKWHSKKFNGPGVKYEVDVCIKTGFIVWINGPVVASTSDITMFKETLCGCLVDDEGVVVDGVYTGHAKFKAPIVATISKARKQKSVVRARHKNVNGRLKIFDILNTPFRHTNPRDKMMKKHGWCFDSVAVITQLKFAHGDSLLYNVQCDVSYD